MAESTARLCRFVDLQGLGEVNLPNGSEANTSKLAEIRLSGIEDLRTREKNSGLYMSIEESRDRSLVGTRVGPEPVSWPEQFPEKIHSMSHLRQLTLAASNKDVRKCKSKGS